MRILLTNDDGIHAEGLAVLERIARQLSDDVWIVAPETDQSGLAHSLTLSEPLRLRKISEKHFALRGTPTDCVIMGIREILPEKPDLVLSGVNDGANMADDVTYSGTIAGAIEGTLQGVRSFALSQAVRRENGRFAPWEVAESFAPDLIRKLSDVELPDGTFLNLNFPNCERGVCSTAVRRSRSEIPSDLRRSTSAAKPSFSTMPDFNRPLQIPMPWPHDPEPNDRSGPA